MSLSSDMDGWKNQNVFFVHSKLDDCGIEPPPFRLVAHLTRRIGNSENGKNPGVRSMAKCCRMKTNTVEEILRRLEKYKRLTIHREAGKVNRYELRLPLGLLYIDRRLDDGGLSQMEVRVLGHMTRLADIETGEVSSTKASSPDLQNGTGDSLFRSPSAGKVFAMKNTSLGQPS